MVEFTATKRPGIFCIQCVNQKEQQQQQQQTSQEGMDHPPMVDGLSAILLGMGSTLAPGLEPKWINIFEIEEEVDPVVRRILDQYPKIIFIDEVYAIKMDKVQCKIWMKN